MSSIGSASEEYNSGREEEGNSVIHLRNVPSKITRDELVKILSPYGKVEEVLALARKQLIVKMDSAEAADGVVEFLEEEDFFEYDGRRIYGGISTRNEIGGDRKIVLKEKKEEKDFSLFFPEFEGNPYKVPNLEYDNSSQEFGDWSDEERLLYYARCHLKRIGLNPKRHSLSLGGREGPFSDTSFSSSSSSNFQHNQQQQQMMMVSNQPPPFHQQHQHQMGRGRGGFNRGRNYNNRGNWEDQDEDYGRYDPTNSSSFPSSRKKHSQRKEDYDDEPRSGRRKERGRGKGPSKNEDDDDQYYSEEEEEEDDERRRRRKKKRGGGNQKSTTSKSTSSASRRRKRRKERSPSSQYSSSISPP